KGDRYDSVCENETHREGVLQRKAESQTLLCAIVRLIGESLLPKGPGKHGSRRNSLIEKHPSEARCSGRTAWVIENKLRMVADSGMFARKSRGDGREPPVRDDHIRIAYSGGKSPELLGRFESLDIVAIRSAIDDLAVIRAVLSGGIAFSYGP